MEGQLNAAERAILIERVANLRPERTVEVGTWLGGGSTLHILKTLQKNGSGHLWGIEADRSVYERMIANITSDGMDAISLFTPLLGFSQEVIPRLLEEFGGDSFIGLVFLDGGDNPLEQIEEFHLLADHIPVGGILFAHDAKRRKGKWLVPYLMAHDNWESVIHDISDEGLFEARKLRQQPSAESASHARSTLNRLRHQPLEWCGKWLPTPLIRVLLALLPRKLLLAVTQGRK